MGCDLGHTCLSGYLKYRLFIDAINAILSRISVRMRAN
jgi:hypothetical protein